MDKFGPFKPDEETMEFWLKGIEATLSCNNFNACDNKGHWCQALVGGHTIIKELPKKTTDDVESQPKLELKAFLEAKSESISEELNGKRLTSIQEDLEEARFLQRVQEEENSVKDRVLTVKKGGELGFLTRRNCRRMHKATGQ